MKNATPMRWLFILSFFPAFAFSQQAALNIKLQLMPDGESWGVYLMPAIALPSNQQFILGTAQVTVVVPTGIWPTDVTSVLGNWEANSINATPTENPTKDYVSFGLLNPSSFSNNFNPASENLLFSFKLDGACPDEFYLVDNQTDPFMPPNSQSSNIGNAFAMLGTVSGGLEYLGNYATAAWDCHDNDGDGVLNAHEDTNGNGIYDAGDASNLNVVDQMTVTEGLKFKLQLMPDGNTWGVYVKPEGITPSLETITGSAQATIVMPLHFGWNNLTSVHGTWSANATYHGPVENPDRTYTSFGMTNEFPHIDFVANQETLLFTFEKIGDCPGNLYLIEPTDPFAAPNSIGSNPGCEISVFDPVFNRLYEYGGNYAPAAWDCHDNDSDNIPNALEDTNGNGVFDSGDISNLNVANLPPFAEQLKFKLQLMPDGNTWGVYVKPIDIFPSLLTVTGSAQVTVVMPLQYQWGSPTSVSGTWLANATIHGPEENPDRTYVSFGLISETPHIDLQAGQETLLFSFEKMEDCPDSIYLIDNNDPFSVPNSAGTNPGNDITVYDPANGLSYQYTGNYDPTAWNCHENIGGGGSNKLKTIAGYRVELPENRVKKNFQSPATDRVEDADASVLSQQATALTAFPNPTSGIVNISLAPRFAEGQATLALFDLQGKKRLETTVQSTNAQLDLSGLPAGVYLVSLAQNGRIAERLKLVKS